MKTRLSLPATTFAIATLTCFMLLSTPAEIFSQATPRPVTPLVNGDKVLFIGNSFTDWFGPLPSAVQAIINASGSGLDVSFTVKVKGMGILKEYATWSTLEMVSEIRKGGWKYVVIQGWEDAISRKDSQTNESGATISDYLGWPACQDTMLKYLRMLDNEVTSVGATTILYEPHVGASGYLINLERSNQTYAMLKSQVSCFHAPSVTVWDSLRYRYPSSVYDCSGTPGSFIDILYHDCGHQNTNGMALDAMLFYTIFTRRSAETLAPLLPGPMSAPDKYEEFAALAYKVGKQILTMNNSGFTDTQAPSTPGGLIASTIMPDSYVLSWTASTDNVGVLGYNVYRDNVLIGTTPTPRFAVGGLAPATTYAMRVTAFDSERNASGSSSSLNVATSAMTAVDTSGVLLSWDFRGLGGAASIATSAIMPGLSATAPSAVISTGPVFLANDFGANGFSMRSQTATSLAAAITAGQYMTFSVAPLQGNTLGIDSVQFRPFTQNQPRNFSLMSSVGGFTAGNELGTISGSASSSGPLFTIAAPGHTNNSTIIEFRVYVWGPDNPWESFGIGNRATASTEKDLLVWGSVKSGAAPLFPTNLSAASLTQTGFTLRWSAAGEAVSYVIYKNGIQIGTSDSLSFPVAGAAIGAVCTMTVRARNGASELSEPSLPLVVIIPDLTAPSVPQNLAVTGLSSTSFTLRWSVSSDNVAVTRYEIFMNGELFSNTIDDYLPVPYLTPSTGYTMTVRAKDAAGNVSALSSPLLVTTEPTGVALRPSGAQSARTVTLRYGAANRLISLEEFTAGEAVDVTVTDIRGRVVLQARGVRPGAALTIDRAARGTHIVIVRQGETVRRIKAVLN